MTGPTEVKLSVLDSHFRIRSGDRRITVLVRELWEPFVIDDAAPGAREIRVEEAPEGWLVEAPPYPSVRALDPWIVASTVRNYVSGAAIGAVRSIVPIHGAAAERDGIFLVLSGAVRAGKTTLLLELLDRGWLLVTDDLVPLDPRTSTATPFPKPLSVRDPARWREVASGWEVPGWLPEPESVGLVPATAVPSTTAAGYRPSVVVFSRYEPGAEGSWERLTPAQTTAWCADNLHTRGPEEPGMLPAIARLGASTPGFAIRYGSTEVALELIGRCLAGLGLVE